LLEEVASYEDLETIDIMTDARHGWRKNAKDTSVVAIGEKTHKVLCKVPDEIFVKEVFIAFTQCHVSFWLTESVLSRMNLLMDKFLSWQCIPILVSKQHKHIQQECNDSIEIALLEEVTSYEDLETIDIMTDARHGWHNKAKDVRFSSLIIPMPMPFAKRL
jgi:diacylglycerol kinase